ncbi:1,5-anhydro-D-fructose reductase-like [Tribolium madens]|uniref:1,5-anhydro-D-fructose reductase-like n=1 Tax=Tribolium madens TaxID=41895 RepID=UPI001CF75C32|nr:1,5-anhydro-D-fructose reductase-like [Tribolium madens]
MSRSLNNGYSIPLIGLGIHKLVHASEIHQVVKLAIDAGYRHFDCAWIYGTEAAVAKAIHEKIKEGVIKREDVYITTKLWNNYHQRKDVVEKLRESLQEMKFCYVDLYLIHWPLGFKVNANSLPLNEGPSAYSDVDYVETWQGMEDCVYQGYTRSIGLANFNSEQITRILKNANIKPTVNHIEVHPRLNQKKIIEFCTQRNILVTGYCPLGINEMGGVPNFPEPTICDEKIDEIARKHRKTAAQVVLNYLISLGICVVTRCSNQFRIREHIDIFDFQLDSQDVEYLDSCNRNQRICAFSAFVDHKYYPFHVEF